MRVALSIILDNFYCDLTLYNPNYKSSLLFNFFLVNKGDKLRAMVYAHC